MEREKLIGNEYRLDAGLSVKVIDATDTNVVIKYVDSIPDRIETFSISDFQFLIMMANIV